ncbi:MAG: 1-acyl-sn-glycerol-3-phosphate acyltransferase [Proteobacteria bacterium]|nr:1-acyl-sn-glycerol-3-phosphate acyltransferase [Pseudomonadota bacterium]
MNNYSEPTLNRILAPSKSIAQLRDYLRAVWFWSAFVLLTAICYVQLLIVVAWYKITKPQHLSHGAHWVATCWARLIMLTAPGWRWNFMGFENLPKVSDPPVVLVANHQSSADIGAMYLTQAQFRWLSKDAVFRLPCIGTAMRWAGYVSISRGNRNSHVAALKASSEWIRRGTSMFYFPEGTRSEDGSLREFKAGAFRLAIEEGVAIQPVIFSGTRNMMLKNSAIPKPASLVLEVLPRVWPKKEESAEVFAERVRQIIGARLKTLENSP